jgi:hypothetical protein
MIAWSHHGVRRPAISGRLVYAPASHRELHPAKFELAINPKTASFLRQTSAWPMVVLIVRSG